MWPPDWPPGATVEYRAGEEPSIRIVHATEGRQGFRVEATPAAISFGSDVDQDEFVVMGTQSSAALATVVGWFLTEADWEAACHVVSRVSGPHAPISVTLAIGGGNVIISTVSPVGRPWLASFPRPIAAALRDSLTAVSVASWDAVASGGPTVTVTHVGPGPG